jgi:hypothetical protein
MIPDTMKKGLLVVKSSLLLGLLFTAAAVSASPAVPSVAPAPLVVQGLGEATMPLNGTWQFHTGDDPSWASPTLDDSKWEGIQVDKTWGAQTHFGYTGYAWYRRHIDFVPVVGAPPNLAILLPPVDDAYELYWNGHQVGHVGKLPPDPVWFYQPPAHTFGLGATRSGVLAIRVWKAPYASFDTGQTGGLNSVPLAGSPEAIAGQKGLHDYVWLRDRQYFFALDLLYGLVFILGMLAWLRDREQKLLFWMSLFALAPVLQTVLFGIRLPLAFRWTMGLAQPTFAMQDVALWFLLLYLLKLDNRPALVKWTRALAWISITSTSLDGLLTMFNWGGQHVHLLQMGDGLFTTVFTVVEVFPLILIPFAFRKRLDPSRWLVAILAFTTEMVETLRIALEQGSRFTHWTIGDKLSAPLFFVDGNPFSVRTLSATLLFIAIVYAVYRYSVEQSDRQAALDQEFRSAQELQRVLVPETLPALQGFAITSAYRPAQEVGGDFFQLIAHPDGSALLLLGDVSGKGLKAAMTVSMIVGAARTLAETSDDPTDILVGLNRRLCNRLGGGFVTALVLRLEPDGRCLLANAGHLPPFLNERELDVAGALPLGIVGNATFSTTTFHLAVGDRLTLYTDGLLEARNRARELYGFERVRELISTRPDATMASDAAVHFGQEDDITVLTLTRLATGVESTTSLTAPALVASIA